MGDASRKAETMDILGHTCSNADELTNDHYLKKGAILVDGVVLNGPLLDAKAGEKFVEEAFPIIMEDAIKKATDVNEKVCEWQPPEELMKLLDLELRDTGESHHQLLQRCRDVIKYSVKTGHPRFYNQLYAGMDHYSLVARFVTEALNPSIYTYEVAPVFVLMEEVVLKKMRELIGWTEGDGIFSPGGSVSNMYAVNLARYKCCPELKENGLSGSPPLAMFTSEESHYSVKKAAAFLGIGIRNVYMVKADKRGKVIPEELEKEIQTAKKEGLIDRCHCGQAGYLFQQDKFYNIDYDKGDKSIQCSRRADAFKFWLTWKAVGSSGLEERVNRAFASARYLADEIKKKKEFRLLMEPEYTNVCFWYIPPSLRDVPEDQDFWKKLHMVAPVIKERMMKKGSMMVGYQPHRDKVNFFRQIIISPLVSREDMDFILNEIDSLGKDL
ncbi:acidic amino acid decarboxylase GADL1-like isoform X4 [Stegostoma tigrinum]|uniref:acidic amino acid decarboxylase GADL1-like isoform X4 n=1 Tax=Stegostoma tigrinum TaxID=3053191 RepID=UPI0028707310|nr:acidic amino acid decarboxylase GADL1-like isoform X4 [Stegostoma tigrinum]